MNPDNGGIRGDSDMLYHGTVRSLPLAGQLEVAAAIGARRLTIGPREYRSRLGSGQSPKEMSRRAADSGVRIDHIDPFVRWVPDSAYENSGISLNAHADSDELFRMADALGARSVTIVAMFPDGAVGSAEMADRFGSFCLLAAKHGLRCDLEFVPIWGLPDLETAWSVFEQAGAANSGILFDTWHYCRGRRDDDLLRRIPGHSITCVQLSDASAIVPPGRDLLEDSRNHRRPPGKGDFPVREIVAILREIGGLNNVGPEIFCTEFDQLSASQIADQCRESMAWALSC